MEAKRCPRVNRIDVREYDKQQIETRWCAVRCHAVSGAATVRRKPAKRTAAATEKYFVGARRHSIVDTVENADSFWPRPLHKHSTNHHLPAVGRLQVVVAALRKLVNKHD